MKFVKITINQVIFKLLLTFAHQISTLISIPLLASVVSSLEFGKVAMCLILLQISWFISEWGVPNYSIELLSKGSKKRDKKDFLQTIIAFKLICFMVLSFVYLLLIKYVFVDLNYIFFLALIPSLLFGLFDLSWFFSLINKTHRIVTVTFIARILFLVGVFFLIKTDMDSYKYLLFHGASLGIISLYSFYILVKIDYIDRWPSIKLLTQKIYHLKKSYIFFLTNLTDNQFPLIWSFVISIIGGAPMVFLYSLADQIFRSIAHISVLISQTIRINLSFKSKNNLFITINFFIFLGVMFSIIGYMYIEQFLSLFFNDDFLEPISLAKLIIIPAAIHYFIRLINFPLFAEYYDVNFVNKVSIRVFWFSATLFGCWAIFSKNLSLLIFLISISLGMHLMIIIFFLIKAKKVNKL